MFSPYKFALRIYLTRLRRLFIVFLFGCGYLSNEL